MKVVTVAYHNVDKPNHNHRYFSKEVLDEALAKFCEESLYLVTKFDINTGKIRPEDIVGKCIKSEWSENNSVLTHTFHVPDDKVFLLRETYPCMFGIGECSITSLDAVNVDNFMLHGFSLCETCAWEADVKIE